MKATAFKEFIKQNKVQLYAFAEQNTPKNSKGQACIEKDDDWADEDHWDIVNREIDIIMTRNDELLKRLAK